MAGVHCRTSETDGQPGAGDNNAAVRLPAELVVDPQLLMAARRGDSKRFKELLRGLNKDDNHDESGMVVMAVIATTSPATASDSARPPAVPLDPKLLMAARRGNITSEQLKNLLLLKEDDEEAGSASLPPRDPVTMEGDTLLHVVAASGNTQTFIDCAKMIVRDKEKKGGAAAARLALEARNNKGDTPLHCAARSGNADMISCLVAPVTGDEAAVKAFLRLQNDLGETALHHAVRAASKPAIDKLLSLDSEMPLACSTESEGEETHAGASAGAGAASCCCGSPFYLAVSLGEMDIARHLFDASSSKCKRKLSYYSGPHGRNVLHAAVSRGQVLDKVIEWFKDESVDVHAQEGEGVMSLPLVSQLSSQRDMQQKGSTPLHLAASLDGWPRASFFRNVFAQESATTSRLLLDANVSTAYQADDEGSYPIHAAAWAGSLGVVERLLERCPDCATLRDDKGRTFLHVAVEQEHRRVVAYAAVRGRLPSLVLNAQENMNGDTALHVAVRRPENLGIFNCLLGNPQVRLDVANKHGMTPLDLSWTMIPAGLYYMLNPRAIVSMSPVAAGAPHGVCRPGLLKNSCPKQTWSKNPRNRQSRERRRRALSLRLSRRLHLRQLSNCLEAIETTNAAALQTTTAAALQQLAHQCLLGAMHSTRLSSLTPLHSSPL